MRRFFFVTTGGETLAIVVEEVGKDGLKAIRFQVPLVAGTFLIGDCPGFVEFLQDMTKAEVMAAWRAVVNELSILTVLLERIAEKESSN